MRDVDYVSKSPALVEFLEHLSIFVVHHMRTFTTTMQPRRMLPEYEANTHLVTRHAQWLLKMAKIPQSHPVYGYAAMRLMADVIHWYERKHGKRISAFETTPGETFVESMLRFTVYDHRFEWHNPHDDNFIARLAERGGFPDVTREWIEWLRHVRDVSWDLPLCFITKRSTALFGQDNDFSKMSPDGVFYTQLAAHLHMTLNVLTGNRLANARTMVVRQRIYGAFMRPLDTPDEPDLRDEEDDAD